MDWKDFFYSIFITEPRAASFTLFFWDGKSDKTFVFPKTQNSVVTSHFLPMGFFVPWTGTHGTTRTFVPYNQIQKVELNLEDT